MKKIYLFLPLFAVQLAFAQNSQLYYSREFRDKNNKPKASMKVLNKNSGVFDYTDEEGFVIISAKMHDTIVWEGGKNHEVVYYPRELKSILENRIKHKTVEAVNSKNYDSLILKPKTEEYSILNPTHHLSKNSDFNFIKVRKLKEKSSDTLKIKQLFHKELGVSGSFSSSFEVRSRNSIPETQNAYVQGRSQNGSLIWRGPETDEIFSFGPHISTLGYNFQPYEYDQNGKLIPLVSGMNSAKPYDNSLFSTTVGFYNQLQINSVIKRDYYDEKLRLSLDLGQRKNQTYFISQYDINNTFKAKLTGILLKFNLQALFDVNETKATNSNRVGLFNRAYQESLLTPISFSNEQGAYLSNGLQRSYSSFGDNPNFLFDQQNKYNFLSNQKKYSVNLSRGFRNLSFNINQVFEQDYFRNSDIFKPSTNGFPNGLINEREQNNSLYNVFASADYRFDSDNLEHSIHANIIINNRKSDVFHSSQNRKYLYERTSQDYNYYYNLKLREGNFELRARAGNGFYISNTSLQNKYWLPKADVSVTFDDIFNRFDTKIKFLGAYAESSTEPDFTRSYSSYSSTLLSAQNRSQYFPIQEVESFRNLSTVDFKEWKTGIHFTPFRRINLEAEYFKRKVFNDIFPVFENNQLLLKNLANHTYEGYEANLSYKTILTQNVRFTNKISFYKYRDVVNRVTPGYNNLPIAGFQDVYKSLSEGEILGSVMGSYFETNASGQTIIDSDGYPVKSLNKKIIANPTPDFVMKLTHILEYKRFTLDVNWEWKKGGQIWNGTQAALDYYGRSKTSGDDRNVQNYIFAGVHLDGTINQTPVNFYDANASVYENRWTRYGITGVAEQYVQNADYIRINSVSLGTKIFVGKRRQELSFSVFANNIMIWQANSGADPNQSFYDQDNGEGLDFFNLPSYKSLGCMVSIQF